MIQADRELPQMFILADRASVNSKTLLLTIRLDFKLCPACSRTANEVIFDKHRKSLHTPSQTSLWLPIREGNWN